MSILLLRRLTLAALATTVAFAGLGARQVPTASSSAGEGFDITNPCTYLSSRQVRKAFGSPVTVDPTNRGSKIPGTCAYLVGDPQQPTAALVAVNVFPGFYLPQGQTAADVVESQRATDAAGLLEVVDADVGHDGFFNVSQASLSLVATSKFAFELQWLPLPYGGPLTPAIRRRLTTLAKVVIVEAKRVG
jgi:hypothetical protein